MAVLGRATFAVVDALPGPLNLIMAGHGVVYENYVIKGGQTLEVGAVLGLITGTNQLVFSVAAAGDGSQVPFAVLPFPVQSYDIDGVTARDTPTKVIVQGVLNPQALQLGAGHTVQSVKGPLSLRGIALQSQSYSG
jgi:hypothetical protein